MAKNSNAIASKIAHPVKSRTADPCLPRPYLGGPASPERLTTATPVTHLLFENVLVVQAGVTQGVAIEAARRLQIVASELLSLGVDEPDEYEVRAYQAMRTAAMFFSEVSSALLCSLAVVDADQRGSRERALRAAVGNAQ
ncbi:MAG: hypothetical protein V4650_11435 [Pseudomonadota bacterium]